jgi:hypothetical protein
MTNQNSIPVRICYSFLGSHDLGRVRPWVAATGMRFVAILCFEIVERHVVIGPHAGWRSGLSELSWA